ncbi:serine/threonine-protein kinase [Sandaracinus amylolyticus]|uniref:serine/threonine-protein kinase n=1 Tax=Sandaracinus amylolyticus TaxID=927083 RepID=UPI001F23159C|nr:serine/threonine-protein kinase [Sandaracinus amylolyticus]
MSVKGARRAVGRVEDASDVAETSSSDGGRALLQSRLALFGRVMVLLTLLGYAMTNLVTLASGQGGVEELVSGSSLAMLGAIVALLVVWLVARGGPLPMGALRALDVIGMVVPATLLDVMALLLSVELRPDLHSRHLVMLLVTTNMAIARAVLVPSRPGWTAAIGCAAALPALVLAAAADGPGEPQMRAAYAFTWLLIAVMTSTFASRVIYGLRRRVREATRLGRYTLVETLGAGGMGVVYRAEHAMLRRPTAVKLLDLTEVGERGLARFEREVQLTAQLTHPNTIAIYDYGRTPDGVFYYAMELVDGLDLEALVRAHGPQPAARVAHLLRQACGSLAEAHEAGLVHRDIKPSNLVVSRRAGQGDVLKVLDFGLVKDVRGEAGDERVSTHGVIVGTPLYLSPEAISAPENVGPASDLYALGAVAYWLLTGTPVFAGTSVVELCASHLSDRPVTPSARGVIVPPKLEALVMACLAKAPSDRPASAAALASAIAASDAGTWTQKDADAWWSAQERAKVEIESDDALAATIASDAAPKARVSS